MDVHKMLQKGISMIHQEILMVPELTIAQNIFLGREFKQGFWLDEQEIDKKSEEILNLIGLNLNVQTKAKQLSIAEMQLIEIAKAISNHAKVIIMDEPTSALSDKESELLFKLINDLKSKGVGIIYISHN
jgi:inositol transport system ATP-binding protein